MSTALVRNKFSQNPSKISFQVGKKLVVAAGQCRIPYGRWELNQYHESFGTLFASKPVAASCDCRLSLQPTRKQPWFLLTRQSRPGGVPERGSKSSAIDFCSQKLRLSSGIAFGVIPKWPAEDVIQTQTWSLSPDQRAVKILSAPKSLNKLCGVWIIFRSVEDAEIEASSESIPTLILQTELDFESNLKV